MCLTSAITKIYFKPSSEWNRFREPGKAIEKCVPSGSKETLQLRHNNSKSSPLRKLTQLLGFIFFQATLPDKPGSRHLYKILSPSEALTRGQKSIPVCLSCPNSTTDEMEYLHREPCNYVDVKMSKNGTFYVMECDGPDVPWSCVHHTPTGKFLRAYETNQAVEVNHSKLSMHLLRMTISYLVIKRISLFTFQLCLGKLIFSL